MKKEFQCTLEIVGEHKFCKNTQKCDKSDDLRTKQCRRYLYTSDTVFNHNHGPSSTLNTQIIRNRKAFADVETPRF